MFFYLASESLRQFAFGLPKLAFGKSVFGHCQKSSYVQKFVSWFSSLFKQGCAVSFFSQRVFKFNRT
jgi:hypothetical protein